MIGYTIAAVGVGLYLRWALKERQRQLEEARARLERSRSAPQHGKKW